MSFTLLKKEDLSHLNSTGYLYQHDKTKSQVMFMVNDDANKTFSIAFATPPYNNNGIAHIIEHSVLCGSRKYKTKEPFVELAKGSLNTFLNAFTASDKTVYPVASQNDKDFKNLMDVYLDAVFFPNMLDNPKILQQEGWHYHLEDEADDLQYKGVVYNEMKGAYSDASTVMYQAAKKALFPDTIYANESGGHPLDIPSLTYEEFVLFHQTYYHPSNAFTFIYGDVDIEENLEHLESYFSHFDYKAIDKGISFQEAFPALKEVTIPYSIASDESKDKKTFLSLEFVVGQTKDIDQYVQYSVLSDVLLGSNAAPLWKALIKANIASDVDGGYNTSLAQSTFDISLSNSELAHKDQFRTIFFDTLKTLVKDGLDPELVKAAINKNKFSIKEASVATSYPKGIYYGLSALNDWLYEGEAFNVFSVEAALDRLEADTSVLLDRIQEGFLDNPHALLLVGVPDNGLNDRLFEEVHQSLQSYKNQLDQTQRQRLVQETQSLLAYQSQEDSKEALETIPLLSLEDINPQAKSFPISSEAHEETTFLKHETFTSGIQYLSYYFDTRGVDQEDVSYINLFAKLLGNLPTQERSVEELATLEDLYTGGIHFTTNVFVESVKDQIFHPKFVVKAKAFNEQTDWLTQLTHDMLAHTVFEDRDLIKEQLLKLKSRCESKFVYQSHSCATYRLRSYYSLAASYEESLNGIDFYRFICDLLANFEEGFEDLVAKLQEVQERLIQRDRLVLGWIGHAKTDAYSQVKASVLRDLPDRHYPSQSFTKMPEVTNEAFVLAQDVQYVAQGYNFDLLDMTYDSRLRVLKTILTYQYLWNQVRVKGGAYGAFNVQTRQGDFIFCSYRDPNVAQTVETYQAAGDFVANLDLDERELTKAIIGTFSELDRPLSPKEIGEVGFMHYFTKISNQSLQNERETILSTRLEDLQKLSAYVSDSMAQDLRCVFGNKQALEKDSQLFNRIENLIQ